MVNNISTVLAIHYLPAVLLPLIGKMINNKPAGIFLMIDNRSRHYDRVMPLGALSSYTC